MSKPAVISSEQVIFFDCDDTLVMWTENNSGFQESAETVGVTDPYEKTITYLVPHKPHIKLLKNRHKRGSTIIVWSANGYAWAENVVRALELEPYVHFIMSKPQAYVDDLTAAEILGERMYLQPDSAWGNK